MTDEPQEPTVPPSEQPPVPQPPSEQPSTPQPPSGQPQAGPDLTMAWLPHLLMVLTWWVGPLVIWLVKKDEDKLANFHGKQAMIWGFIPTALLFFAMVIAFIPVLGMLMMCFFPLLYVGNMVYGIIAIMQTSKGEPFKYFFVADQFCAREFAEAYPDAAGGQQQDTQPPEEQ